MDLPNTEAERMAMWDGTYVKPEPTRTSGSEKIGTTDADTGNSVKTDSDASNPRGGLESCFGVRNVKTDNGDQSDDEMNGFRPSVGSKTSSSPHVGGLGVEHASDEGLDMSSKPTPKKAHSWIPFKFGTSKKSARSINAAHPASFETPMKEVVGTKSKEYPPAESVIEETPADSPVLSPAVLEAKSVHLSSLVQPSTATSTTAPSVQGSEASSWKMK